MESHLRSVVKAFTYRCGGLLVTGLVTLLITKRIDLAASVALADTLAKLGAFYVHERLWLRIRFGREQPSDYEI